MNLYHFTKYEISDFISILQKSQEVHPWEKGSVFYYYLNNNVLDKVKRRGMS